jgi:hypothetical protein
MHLKLGIKNMIKTVKMTIETNSKNIGLRNLNVQIYYCISYLFHYYLGNPRYTILLNHIYLI